MHITHDDYLMLILQMMSMMTTWDIALMAKLLCRVCGICSFYQPRSNPDGYAVTVHCLDRTSQPKSVTVKQCDGHNWETSSTINNMAELSNP